MKIVSERKAGEKWWQKFSVWTINAHAHRLGGEKEQGITHVPLTVNFFFVSCIKSIP